MRNDQEEGRGDVRVTIGYSKDGTPGFNVHVETGDRRTHWTGERREEMLAWISAHLGRLFPSASEEDAAAVAGPVLIDSSRLDPPGAEELDMEFVDLALEEAAGVSGTRAIEASGRLRVYCDRGDSPQFRVEFILVDLDHGHKQTAAVEHGDVQPGEWVREIHTVFPIPGKGRYQIRAVVKHSPAGLVLAESVGPTLRVVE